MDMKFLSWLPGVLLAAGLCGAPQEQSAPGENKAIADTPPAQTLRLVQDDAQDYMVSRIFKGKLNAVFRRVAQIVFHFGRKGGR